jgi:hypothetical protein
MKKTPVLFICGILLSILALEGVTRLVSPLLGPPLIKWNTMEDAKALKLKEFELKYSKPKYIFMGNSTVLIGFDPPVFDTEAGLSPGSSFNAAMNGSEIRHIRDFACSYILKEVEPKNLVILFSNTGMATDYDYHSLTSGASTLEKYFYIYRYRNTFRDPMTINTFIRIMKFRDKRQGIVYRWADNLGESGYTKYPTTEATVATPGWNPSRIVKLGESSLPMLDTKGIRYLTEIRDLLRSQGGNLILGTVPTLSFSQNYRESIEQMAEYLDVAFVQGNDAVGEGKYFQDGVHLNRQGATEFSKFLARELLKSN